MKSHKEINSFFKQMNAVKFSSILAIALWAMFFNYQFFLIFFLLIFLCTINDAILQTRFHTNTTQKIHLARNPMPTEPKTILMISLNNSKIEEFIETSNKTRPQDSKLTSNMVYLLIMGRAMKKARISGKYVFENFIESEHSNSTIPVDVNSKSVVNLLVKNLDVASLEELKAQLKGKIALLKKGIDPAVKKQQEFLSLLPSFLIALLIRSIVFISYNFSLTFPPLKVTPEHFGCSFLSNVSGFEVYRGCPTLGPRAKTVLSAILCAHKKVVKSEGKSIVIRNKEAILNVSMDSRVISPVEVGTMVKEIKRLWEDPKELMPSTK